MDDRWLIQTLQTSYIWITIILLLGQHTEKAKCQITASCLHATASATTPQTCCKCTAQPPSFHCRELCLPGFFATEYTVGKCDPEFLKGSQSTATEEGLSAQNGNSLSIFENSNISSNESTKDQSNLKDSSTITSAATPNNKHESHNITANEESFDSYFPTSIKSCVPCHTACKGCNGPGPRNCIQCAENFERIHDSLDRCVAKDFSRSTMLHTGFSGRTSSSTTAGVVPLETGSDASLAFSRASVILSAVILPFIVVLTLIFIVILCLRLRLKRQSSAAVLGADWRSGLSSEAGQPGDGFSLDIQPYINSLPRKQFSSGRRSKWPGYVFCCFRKPGNRRGRSIPVNAPLYRVPIANTDVENGMSETLCGYTDDNPDYASIGNSHASLEVQFEKSPLVSGAEDFALKSLEAGVLTSSDLEYLSPVSHSSPSGFSSEESNSLSKAYRDYRAFTISEQTSMKTPAIPRIKVSPQKPTIELGRGLDSKLMKSKDDPRETSYRPLPAVREDLIAVTSQPPPLPPRNRTQVLHDRCSKILTEAGQPSVGYFTATHLSSPAEFALGGFCKATTKAKNTECVDEGNHEQKVSEKVTSCLAACIATEHEQSAEGSSERYPDETFAKVARPFTTPDDTSSGTDDSRAFSSISCGTSFQSLHHSHSSFWDLHGPLPSWNSRNKTIPLYSCAPWRPVAGLPETCYDSSSSGLLGTYSSGTTYGPFCKVCFIQNASSSEEYYMSTNSMVNDGLFLPGSKARHTFTDVLDTESEPRSDYCDSWSYDDYYTERLEDFERGQRCARLNSQGLSHPYGVTFCAEDFVKTSLNPGAEAAERELTMKNLVSSYCATTSTQTAPAESGSDSKPTFSGAWQNEQSFGYDGGVLQTADSDVRLEVPVGAVERTQYSSIKTSVCTDLRSVYARFASLPPSEHIASPVVEYFAGHDVKFCKPVKIILPHFLPPKISPERVSVYVFRHDQLGRLSLKKLTLQSRDNARNPQSDVFYFGDDKHIVVVTDHFSGYFCTHCSTQGVSQTFHPVVFARNVEKGPGARVVDLRLEIWDDRLWIKDFKKMCFERQQTANDQNMQPIDLMSLPPVSGGFDLDKLFIGAKIDFISEEVSQAWMHMKRRDGQLIYPEAVTVSMRELTACECQRPTIPKRLDWKLSNQNGVVPEGSCDCLIDVGYVTSGIVQHGDHLSLMPSPKVTFNVSVGATSETHWKPEKNHAPESPENNARSLPARQQQPTALHNDLSGGQTSAQRQPPPLFSPQSEAGPQGGFSDHSEAESELNAFPTLDSERGAVHRAEHHRYLPGTADSELLPGSDDGVPQSRGRTDRPWWNSTSQRPCRVDAPPMVPQSHYYPQNQTESGRFQDHHRRSDVMYTGGPPGSNYAPRSLPFNGDPRGYVQSPLEVQAAHNPRGARVQSNQSLQYHGNPGAVQPPTLQSSLLQGDPMGYGEYFVDTQATYAARETLVPNHSSLQFHSDRGAHQRVQGDPRGYGEYFVDTQATYAAREALVPNHSSLQFYSDRGAHQPPATQHVQGDPWGYVQAPHASREGIDRLSVVCNTDSGMPYSGGQVGHQSGNNWGGYTPRRPNTGYSDLQRTYCHPSVSCPYPSAREPTHCFPSPSIPGNSQCNVQPPQSIIITNPKKVSFSSCLESVPNNRLQQSANNGDSGTHGARAHGSSGACDLSTYQNLASLPGSAGRDCNAGAPSTNQHVACTSAVPTSTTPGGAIATHAFTGEDLLTTSQASSTANPEGLPNTASYPDSTNPANVRPRVSSTGNRHTAAGIYAPAVRQQGHRNGPELSDRAEELLRYNTTGSSGESLEVQSVHDCQHGVQQNGRTDRNPSGRNVRERPVNPDSAPERDFGMGLETASLPQMQNSLENRNENVSASLEHSHERMLNRNPNQNCESEEVSNASDTEYVFTMSEPVQASEQSS